MAMLTVRNIPEAVHLALRAGVALLPSGKRKSGLQKSLEKHGRREQRSPIHGAAIQ